MDKKTENKNTAHHPKKKPIIIAVTVVFTGILIFWLIQQLTPQRSIESYCKVYNEEKARLSTLPGDTWPAGIFNDELSDAGEIATSIKRLEKVAPDEMQPDIKTLVSIYQKIDSDPSQALSASLSGVEAEANVKEWTKKQCHI